MPRTLLAVAGCVLLATAAGCGRSSAPAAHGASYTLMQMNLCLSGLAACYARVAYPAGVDAAAALIRTERPDAVTLNEACSGDAARIARQTGYHLRFSTVVYGGAPFACIRPGGRGVFGDAILTAAPILAGASRAFRAQAGIERRRWLCVATRGGVQVCTSHLATRDAVEVRANDGQCPELAAVLTRRAAARPLIFGGDVNRRSPCAPAGFWIRTDAGAGQDAGLQQVYGTRAFRAPAAEVVPFGRSDHDVPDR